MCVCVCVCVDLCAVRAENSQPTDPEEPLAREAPVAIVTLRPIISVTSATAGAPNNVASVCIVYPAL